MADVIIFTVDDNEWALLRAALNTFGTLCDATGDEDMSKQLDDLLDLLDDQHIRLAL